jgi:hypothetical protein
MAHERETLEAVIQARNAAQAASRRAENDPADGAAMRDLMGAEQALGGLLTRFFALAEAYPDLKANQNMAQLQEELASTENRIAFSRQAYNDAVTAYNIKREQFAGREQLRLQACRAMADGRHRRTRTGQGELRSVVSDTWISSLPRTTPGGSAAG